MLNSTNTPTPLPQQCPPWCDSWNRHTGEHAGQADQPAVTATGNRDDQLSTDHGVRVPEVVVRLVQDDGPTNLHPRQRITVSVVRPDGDSAACSLTVDEAALLRAHLTELLQATGTELAS